jgi:hypothetical protein
MKTTIHRGAFTMMIMLGLSLTFTRCSEGAGTDDGLAPDNAKLKSISQAASLSEDEIAAIQFMREEEKLARDVYQTLYETFPLRPFLNISKSEQAHMDAILYLIDTYELEDPAGDNPKGVFVNQDLQELYNDLIEQGSECREEALKVGALIEEVDITDLESALAGTAQNEDVIRVFTNLCHASERHLKAFVRVLKIYDVEYAPVHLDQEVFDRIMAD